jgi:hypothetical protein
MDEQMEHEAEDINVEEEPMTKEEAQSSGKQWQEDVKVAGEELVQTVKKLMHEAGVRRVIIKNSEGQTLFEIPLVFGVAGIALLPTLAAVGLVGALLTDCTITVIRTEKPAPEETVAPEQEAMD